MDLPADRIHPRKRKRPFAEGTASVKKGVVLFPLLWVASLGISVWLGTEFLAVLIGYSAITLAYSLLLKQKVLVDVLLLAGLYTLRIIAGGAVGSIPLSFWLLAFSMFIFLSLAMVKRYSELSEVKATGIRPTTVRGYEAADLETLRNLGSTSGYMATVVLALYINTETVKAIYSFPQAIWILCPLLVYWISRIWIMAGRGKMPDDPLIFVVKDHVSRGIAIVTVLVLLLANWSSVSAL